MDAFEATVSLARTFAKELIRKSGVREWEDEGIPESLAEAAWRMAILIVYLATNGTSSMANKVLIQALDGTPPQICFANHAGDFSPTAANNLEVGTPTDCEMAITGLANAAYWQSAKVDLGENRADEYAVRIAIELAATPTAGNAIELWWAPSGNATVGTANAGGVSGANGTYAGYSSNAAASVKQLQYIGAGIVTAQATATVQVMEVGRFRPTERWGSLVLLNGSGAAVHSDDVECHTVFDPCTVEIQ